MTTIAYRDGVMAADTQSTAGWTRAGKIVKIARSRKGVLAGAAGSAGYNYAFVQWAANGCKGAPPDAQEKDGCGDSGILVRPDGTVERYENGGMFISEGEYFAEGSGQGFALGAMAMGATAEQAVEIAARFDVGTGGAITVLRR